MDTLPAAYSHPVLSCAEAVEHEKRLLGSAADEWAAMQRVGVLLARGIREAYAMCSFSQRGVRVLALVGKGHNGGDALLALSELALEDGYLGGITLALSGEVSSLRPHTRRALERLESRFPVEFVDADGSRIGSEAYDICLDGMLGMQFRPPLREGIRNLIERVNGSDKIRFRVAVDLPSGMGDISDIGAFEADITFATGIFKRPLLVQPKAGAVRYLDIGFFDSAVAGDTRVLTDRILDPLRRVRPVHSEKRRYGHLAILAGSRGMPGALAMAVQAALRSGVGLVTVFAPESVVAQLACALPEAMWRTWPETPEGGLALEGLWQVKSIEDRATALLAGPGMGTERETQALLAEVGRTWSKPAVLDADALRPEVVEAFVNSPLILTPHDGEFLRLAGSDGMVTDAAIMDYARAHGLTLIKKGSATRISDGGTLYINPTGNAVLARGGSGDLLAGLAAGLLAQGRSSPVETACRAVYWHGRAADLLAQTKGQVAIRTTELLDWLVPALRDG